MKSLTQPILLVGALGVMGWICWRLQRDEQIERMGVDEKEWKRHRKAVRAAMGDPWEKAWRKMIGIKRLGNMRLRNVERGNS